MVCGLLLQRRDDPRNGVRWIVCEQNMDVILVRLHTPDVPVVLPADIKQGLFDVVPEVADEQLPPILRNKYEMDHQKVFVMATVLKISFRSQLTQPLSGAILMMLNPGALRR